MIDVIYHFFCYRYPSFIVYQSVGVELLSRDNTGKHVLDRELAWPQ